MRARLHQLIVPGLGVLGLCAAVAGPCAAQDQPTEFPTWRVPGWSFTPGVSIGILRDSNVAIASPDVNQATASDTLFQMEPSGQLEFFSARTSFSSGYRGALRRYFELDNLNSVDHRAFLSLRHRATRRVTVFADEDFTQVPTTDLLELNGVPFQRTGSRLNALGGGVDARLTKSLDLTTRYEMTWVDFLAKDTPLTGAVVHGVHTALTHRLGARVSAGGEYGIRKANLNDGSKQFLFQDVGGVVQYRLGEHTLFDASGGLTHLVDHAREVTRTGPYAKVGITHHAERATFGGEYHRSYAPSFVFGGSNRSQEARGFIDMPFNRNRLYVQESASWRRTEPFVEIEPALDSIWLRSTLGYALHRWLRVEGYHTLTSQDNRLAGGRITRHIVGAQLVVSEPMRIR